MTPQQLSQKATTRLQALGNPASAQDVKRFFKPHEQISAYGVSLGRLRKLTTELFGKIKREWTLSEASEFCSIQLASDFMESNTSGFFYWRAFENASRQRF